MIMVPIRVVEKTFEGVLCRLGSEPADDAPVELVPSGCITKFVETEGSDLGIIVLDPKKIPEGIRKALGMS